MREFDIAPDALPNTPPGEVRFEEVRDIRQVVVQFKGGVPGRLGVSYLRNTWPRTRIEQRRDLEEPVGFGWIPTDDWFNGQWQRAATVAHRKGSFARITFRGLAREYPEAAAGYDVAFRRTHGLRLHVPDANRIRAVQVFTTSQARRSVLRVRLDAGTKTPGESMRLAGYNARIGAIRACHGVALASRAIRGVRVHDGQVMLGKAAKRAFEITVDHMRPAHRYCNDAGLVTFGLDRDAFTISLDELLRQGPVWYADQGVFITLAEDDTTFGAYSERIRGSQTILQQVRQRPQQSYGGALHGQPRPHAVSYNLGCKHARQRFRVEANGDILLTKRNVTWIKGEDTHRFRSRGDGRFFFGLESWVVTGRFTDPAPVPVYNIHTKTGSLLLEQKSLCVPLETSILDGETPSDATMVALVRFRFQNAGDAAARAELPTRYSQDSARSHNALSGSRSQDDNLVPTSKLDKLTVRAGRITSRYRGKPVLRCTAETTMRASTGPGGITFAQRLRPGEHCELLLKIPYVALETHAELSALAGLDFERSHAEVTRFWRTENRRGSQLRCPVEPLNALYAAHLTHVEVTDLAMPDGSGLVNTSVGTSTYGNFPNESCMIVQELDQRGLHEECRRRLDLWVKYQGTAGQPGNFTDFDGMYFGAGGFECGSYNQHHGWVLWCLAEHYRLTRDRAWFGKAADSVIAACDWVFRQRRNTMADLPHSRGWERGFLPAGSLEDVTEFWYWLSTNCLTWRSTDAAARALEQFGHAQAPRIRRESNAFRADLRRGFETARRHAPLVRLRDGRWVPHYPSRLYLRGRDYGWIRETLEGSVYLLISGLYDARSKQAAWILDDYQDNRYISPPYGYVLRNPDANFFARGGFSIQPNLLAGLMPHLERDEIDIYLWMFFNAWCACYREEINAMVEHPTPELGYSNAAHFKTSDEANAVMWLRYMFVYWNDRLLHLGRAIPRAWLEDGGDIAITKVRTYFGTVDVRYVSHAGAGRIRMEARLRGPQDAARVLARFAHPHRKPIHSVTVNGRRWRAFDPVKGDVDITGLRGTVVVEAAF